MTADMKTPAADTDVPKKPVATRKRTNKVNAIISDELRQRLLELISETNSIRRAAQQLGINSNTAKSIYYKFCKTGISKKLVRTRADYRRDFVFQKPSENAMQTQPAEQPQMSFHSAGQEADQTQPTHEMQPAFVNPMTHVNMPAHELSNTDL